jgi:integrase/recombinase XerD
MKFENDFIENLIENDKSQNTIDSYISDIKIFEKDFNICIEKTNLINIKKYIIFLENKCMSPSTINRKLASIKVYINFINSHKGYSIDISKAKQVKVQDQSFLKDFLNISEVKRLIKFAKKVDDKRAIALIYTLLFTGGRVSEVLQLKVDDIDNNIILIKGKGNKYRNLLLPKKLNKVLKEYVQDREKGKLFIGIRGPINRQTVHDILKKYAGKARIKLSKVHAHSFRHLYTKILFEKNVPYTAIQQLLGHTLTVTEIYGQLDRKELLKIINSINI